MGVGEIIAHFGELSLNVSRVKVVATDMCLNCLTRSQVGIFVYLCIYLFEFVYLYLCTYVYLYLCTCILVFVFVNVSRVRLR